jgi:hypothetical protein
VKESYIQDLDNKHLLSSHSHAHYMAFIIIYVYIYIYMLEREEEVEATEERTPPPSDSQAGNCFYFDICGSEPDSPVNEGKPRCMQPFPCVFK